MRPSCSHQLVLDVGISLLLECLLDERDDCVPVVSERAAPYNSLPGFEAPKPSTSVKLVLVVGPLDPVSSNLEQGNELVSRPRAAGGLGGCRSLLGLEVGLLVSGMRGKALALTS
jgi:hypothetical protein